MAPSTRPLDERSLKSANALDGLRQRLTTLASALNDYRGMIQSSPTMPPWQDLQTRAQNVATNIAAVTNHIGANHTLLSDTSAYPNTEFNPFQETWGLMHHMFDRKVAAGTEDWMEAARLLADQRVSRKRTVLRRVWNEDTRIHNIVEVTDELGEGPNWEEWNEFWGGKTEGPDEGGAGDNDDDEEGTIKWRGPGREFGALVAESLQFMGYRDFTQAELDMGVENVRHGLKRDLEEDVRPTPGDDDDSEDGDANGRDDQDGDNKATDDRMSLDGKPSDAPPIAMDEYLRFLSGAPPQAV